MSKHVTMVLAALGVLWAASGVAQANAGHEEPTVYVIQQGDTLWGLSERFMKDPFYWPNLWAKNPADIGNPHFIFPGQKLKIYADHVEIVPATPDVSPGADTGAATKPALPSTAKVDEAVAQERSFAVSGGEGFILEKGDKPLGMIISAQQNRRIVGEDDQVYVDLGRTNGVKVGDRFTVYKKFAAVSHPVTNLIIGERVIPLGTLQLTEVDDNVSKALITRSFMEIEPGAYLGHLRSPRKEVVLKAANRDLTGFLIETKTGNNALAAGDVAYLDLGKKQGLAVGNMLYVVRDVQVDQQYVTGPIQKLPVDVLGAVVVVDAGENTSTALVVKSIDTIYRGDRVELRKNR
jgi:LysM repeat protein